MERLPIDAAVERLRNEGRVPLLLIALNVDEGRLEGFIFNDQTAHEVEAVLKKHKIQLHLRPLT